MHYHRHRRVYPLLWVPCFLFLPSAYHVKLSNFMSLKWSLPHKIQTRYDMAKSAFIVFSCLFLQKKMQAIRLIWVMSSIIVHQSCGREHIDRYHHQYWLSCSPSSCFLGQKLLRTLTKIQRNNFCDRPLMMGYNERLVLPLERLTITAHFNFLMLIWRRHSFHFNSLKLFLRYFLVLFFF